MSMVREIAGLVVLAGGVFFVIVAAVGQIRLPDVFCRSHAIGKAMTLGVMLIVLGYGLSVPDAPWLKLILLLIFQLMTIPVASHLFCLIAYRKGVRRYRAKAVWEEGEWERIGNAPQE
ncbi:MAG TPA: monovalent cation/H(+) antiporter subunit G [Myxococcaceae bacterium]|nr:monovalent cation/H(+) antiporter subunit G [Myxococcaceae bacterium]